MAVSVKALSKDLVLTFEKVNDEGKSVTETRRIKNVKVGATTDDIHGLGGLIAGLCEQTCLSIGVQDVSELTA